MAQIDRDKLLDIYTRTMKVNRTDEKFRELGHIPLVCRDTTGVSGIAGVVAGLKLVQHRRPMPATTRTMIPWRSRTGAPGVTLRRRRPASITAMWGTPTV